MAQERGLWPWLLQRITGLYLVFGMTLHVIVLPLGKESITFESVAARLQHPWWVVFDLSLLAVCVYHGFNGLWSVFLDFDPPLLLRRGVAWALILFGIIWTIFGIFVLIPFAT